MTIRQDYTQKHNRNILREESTSHSKIRHGNIARFRYKGEYARVERPLVLILNPDWKGYLHAISIDAISEDLLEVLFNLIREKDSEKIERLKKLRLPLLRADIGDPLLFYNNTIKRLIKTHQYTSYRTYKRSGITNIRIIDYKFRGKLPRTKYIQKPTKVNLKKGRSIIKLDKLE